MKIRVFINNEREHITSTVELPAAPRAGEQIEFTPGRTASVTSGPSWLPFALDGVYVEINACARNCPVDVWEALKGKP